MQLLSKARAMCGRQGSLTRLTGMQFISYLRKNTRHRVAFQPDIPKKMREMRIHTAAMEHGIDGRELKEGLKRFLEQRFNFNAPKAAMAVKTGGPLSI